MERRRIFPPRSSETENRAPSRLTWFSGKPILDERKPREKIRKSRWCLERVVESKIIEEQERNRNKKKKKDLETNIVRKQKRFVELASRFSSMPVRSFRNLAPKFSISTIEMIMVGDDDRCEIPVNRGRGSTEEGDYGILKRCVWERRFQPRVLCAAIRFIH